MPDIVWSQCRDSLGSCAKSVIYDGVTLWYFIKSSNVDWRQKSPPCCCKYPANVSHLNPYELESCWNPSCSCFSALVCCFVSISVTFYPLSWSLLALKSVSDRSKRSRCCFTSHHPLLYSEKERHLGCFCVEQRQTQCHYQVSAHVMTARQSVENGWRVGCRFRSCS